MNTKQAIRFTEEDKEMLRKKLPDNPCLNCGMRFGCCGCVEAENYQEEIEPYKEAGIYDIACALQKIDTLKQNILSAEEEMKNIIETIPEEIYKDVINTKK